LKKHIFLILFVVVSLFADVPEAKILHYIVKNIDNNSLHKIWSDDSAVKESFEGYENYFVVKDKNQADLLIVKDALSLNRYKGKGKICVLQYDLLIDIPKSFCAFFWKKGRPNIVFIKPRVDKQHIKLSKELQDYEEEKVW